jgi:hypothetical protein
VARSSAPGQTAVDYVTIALSPALIMGLVGSLVFFLLEVFYRTDGKGPDWKDRLQWILFFYVFGAVLVSRISMMSEIASRFWWYGSILAVLTYVGLQRFVDYPDGVKEISFVVNAGLVTLIWWCAHRLTWDCTNVDEDADASGEGVLQAAGLASSEGVEGEAPAEPEDKTLWQRWKEYQERRAKKRTLGVWVVYFSLAALPIFGLGQSLIPLTSPERRQFTFWLMTIYVGCGLGLLLTTCFLGLRRYLRQKRLQMPAAMTGAWLTMGGLLVFGLLAIGALLPRPYAEYRITDVIDPAGAKKRQADRFALKGDSPAEGKGQPGQGDPNAKEGGKVGEQGKGPGQDKDGKGEQGKGKDKDGKGKGDDKDGKSGSDSERDKGKAGNDNKTDKANQQDKGNTQKEGQKGKQDEGGKKGDQQKDAGKGMKDMEKGQQNNPSNALSSVQQFLQRIGPWLKWIVFALIAVLVLVALFRGGLGWLSNFSTWAKGLLDAWKKFWERFFGRAKAEATSSEEDARAAAIDPSLPFSSYSNPFESGRADRLSARQLVRYSFAALEAWARERGLERRADETALEFAGRLGEEIPALEAEARRLALLHARAEYATGDLPPSTAEVLRSFWDKLDRVATAPMSA